ncbi:peptidase [Nakamurella sp. YIM 132087]|uniref:Peptidase n=1 Tax=Nakamurella alba TaxID=2665158 RepID=A0A7K1FLV2_9ACTN|nr:peptidase [Nakamurella alba]MTD14299.1 peptidase [Nakamurella alba]
MEAQPSSPQSVEVSAFQADGLLSGFVVSGRWPETTLEWLKFLVLAVRVASVPGLLPMTTVFSVREELPDNPHPGTVGLVLSEGTFVGDTALPPGHFADHQPAGLFVLHPPSETTPALPELDGVASGCVLLPGIPHLGLDHRAGWAQADHTGAVTSMVTRAGIDPKDDADTAVLAMLLAA